MGIRTTCGTSKERIGRARRATQALRLRISGLTFIQIGEKMGISGSRACTIIKQELSKMNARRTETAAQLARLELERMDELFHAVWDEAKSGDIAAQQQCLRIMERRAKLLGLDVGDKQAAPATNVVLNVSEVLIESREDIGDANGAKAIQASQEPVAIPAL
jgi:hypothetical protein